MTPNMPPHQMMPKAAHRTQLDYTKTLSFLSKQSRFNAINTKKNFPLFFQTAINPHPKQIKKKNIKISFFLPLLYSHVPNPSKGEKPNWTPMIQEE